MHQFQHALDLLRQVERSEWWAIIQLFHGYDARHVVSPLPPRTCYPVIMPIDSGDGEKTTSIRLFTLTLIRSALTYASETLPLTLRDEEALRIFERKILRCILDRNQVNGSWKRKSNLELYKFYKQPDIVKVFKLQELKWDSHLARMNEDGCCKKIFRAKSMGNRPQGRPPFKMD
ncbi:putative endonuclease-reverse transcriptase [Trichonephila clavipes]|nr:putative endonuclease-reverse transcriptase [Trichonephila clavipes]